MVLPVPEDQVEQQDCLQFLKVFRGLPLSCLTVLNFPVALLLLKVNDLPKLPVLNSLEDLQRSKPLEAHEGRKV